MVTRPVTDHEIDSLLKSALFKGIDEALLKPLIPIVKFRYGNGELAIKRGDEVDFLGFVISGSFNVQIELYENSDSSAVFLYNCAPGQFFGISKLFDQEPHYADVRPATPQAECIKLNSLGIIEKLKGDALTTLYRNAGLSIVEKFKQRGNQLVALRSGSRSLSGSKAVAIITILEDIYQQRGLQSTPDRKFVLETRMNQKAFAEKIGCSTRTIKKAREEIEEVAGSQIAIKITPHGWEVILEDEATLKQVMTAVLNNSTNRKENDHDDNV